MDRRTFAVAAILAVGTPYAVACRRPSAPGDRSAAGASNASMASASPKGSTERTLQPTWSPHELKFPELPDATVQFAISEARYEIRLHRLPAGTVVATSGREHLLSPQDDTVRVDLLDAMSRVSPALAGAILDEFDPKLEFELRVPGFRALRVTAPLRSIAFGVTEVLAKAADHSVLFPGERADDPPAGTHSIAYARGTSFISDFFGPAATLRDVDWVAVAHWAPEHDGKTCNIKEMGYGMKNPNPVVKLVLMDAIVTLVERKTSRIIERKVFPATNECPHWAIGPTMMVYPEQDVIKDWLRQVRQK